MNTEPFRGLVTNRIRWSVVGRTASRAAMGVRRSVLVAKHQELAPGETKKFLLHDGQSEIECFLLNYEGELYAYVNRCCHVPMTLDWIENRFLTPDKQFIQCATHGACYLPRTGECVAGPPLGRSLTAVPIRVVDGEVWAEVPDVMNG